MTAHQRLSVEDDANHNLITPPGTLHFIFVVFIHVYEFYPEQNQRGVTPF